MGRVPDSVGVESLVRYGEIVKALRESGIQEGDTLFVHSRLFSIGLLGDVPGPSEIPGAYLRAFREVLGESGTIVVPTYTTSFGRHGKPFIFEESPSEMGLFSETVRTSPSAQRSLHPIYSVAALGARAGELTKDHPPWNVGFDTIWDRIYQRGGKVVGVGLPLRQCLSFIHHVEYLACVPYLYHKLLEGEVIVGGQPRVKERFIMVVRYLDFDVMWDLSRLEKDLQSLGLLLRASLGSSWVSVVCMRDVFDVCMKKLRRDPYYLLKKPPLFVPGQIPTDGPSARKETVPPAGYFEILE